MFPYVTYYLRGPEKPLTFRWPKGLQVQQIVTTYEDQDNVKGIAQGCGHPMIKVRHPEFET